MPYRMKAKVCTVDTTQKQMYVVQHTTKSRDGLAFRVFAISEKKETRLPCAHKYAFTEKMPFTHLISKLKQQFIEDDKM